MGREARINGKLTKKQTLFIKRISEGKSTTEAALDAYNTDSTNVARVIASENLSKPTVRQALEEVLSSQGLSLDTIVGNLGEIANAKVDKISGEVKLKANTELLKLYDANVYPNKNSSHTRIDIRGQFETMSFNELKGYFDNLKAETLALEEDIK